MSNWIASCRNTSYKADQADIVIVGNGIAGLTAAVEARQLAPDASIVMITEQIHPTINTPALKQFTVGKVRQDQLLAYPAGTERSHRIHVINARVEAINAQSKFVYLDNGCGFGYGSLLLATGSKPTGLPDTLPGRHFDGILTLHRLTDYLNLRRRLPEVQEAVVIGGGAHAIETVMGLLHVGISVHWLIRGKDFLAKMLDHSASEMVLAHIRRLGAKVYTNTEVLGIVGRVGSVAGVMTNTQQMLPCQLVLACTGTTPVMSLAEYCNVPMVHNTGILVDAQLRTNVRDIYAAGDVAALKNPLTGAYETRPVWYASVLQGRTVAATMTGQAEQAAQPFGVSWHATQLGELCMLSVGNLSDGMESVTNLTYRGKKSYRRMSIIDDRLVGYLSLGTTQPDSLAIKRIIDEGLSISDIKKALLHGKFDARKYFSRKQTHAARDMVTSGNLPVVRAAQPSPFLSSFTSARLPAIRISVSHTTVALYALNSLNSANTEPMDLQDNTDPLQSRMSQTDPFTPIATVLAFADQKTLHALSDEDITASTEDLSGVSADVDSQELEPISNPLLALPTAKSRSLWSYSTKLLAVKTSGTTDTTVTSVTTDALATSVSNQPISERKKRQFVMLGEE